MTYKYPLIYANKRLLQKSFSNFHFLFISCIKEVLAPEVLEKDIKGLKRKKGLKKRKVWYWKLCVIYMWNFAISKYKIKVRKKMQSFLHNSKSKYWLNWGIYGLNSPETLKYWVGIQWGQSYLMTRRCLFSLGWPPF